MATMISKEEAYAHLSEVLDRAMGGEEIVIAQGGEAKLKLVPVAGPEGHGKRRFGLSRGQYTVPDSFFDSMTEDDLREWGY